MPRLVEELIVYLVPKFGNTLAEATPLPISVTLQFLRQWNCADNCVPKWSSQPSHREFGNRQKKGLEADQGLFTRRG